MMAITKQLSDIKWKIIPEETSIASITFVLDNEASSMGAIKVSTKWDGCTHLWLPYDERLSCWHEDKLCYHHVCDMDQFILYLQSVRERARAYFNGEFGLAPLVKHEHRLRVKEIQAQEQEA